MAKRGRLITPSDAVDDYVMENTKPAVAIAIWFSPDATRYRIMTPVPEDWREDIAYALRNIADDIEKGTARPVQ